MAYNSQLDQDHSFTYTGLYTNPFTTQAEVLDFKEAIEQLVTKTNADLNAITIKYIDNVRYSVDTIHL